MNHQPPQQVETSPWPHRLAVGLVCATFPLIWVGGLVTTTKAGMAVPDWPNTFGYNLFLYPWKTWLFGPWDLFIEHGHRLFAATVGMITVVLVVAVWRCDDRKWVRWLAVGALAAVIGQGVLGGARVLMNERTLAQIHACLGPAFFALTVTLAVVTSRRWREHGSRTYNDNARGLQTLAAFTTLLAFGQLVLGSQLRHVSVTSAPSDFRIAVFFHLLLAAVLLAHAAALMVKVSLHFRRERSLVRPAAGLAMATFIQVGLGLATWVVKYGPPAWLEGYSWAAGYTVTAGSMTQATIITSHVAVGSLIIALALVITLRGLRFFRPARRTSRSAAGKLAAWQLNTARAIA